MPLFSIDTDKCNQDGICADVCPLGIIDFKQYPVPAEDADDLCISCGHCVAVCPSGAFSHRQIDPDQCSPVNPDLQFFPEQIEHGLSARRSIRVYQNKPVDPATLKRLIRIARYAPSGHNAQPVKWLVIQDKEEVQRLAGMVVDWMRNMMERHPKITETMHIDRVVHAWDAGIDNVCRHAPHLILTHGDKRDSTAQSACIIATTYLELAAPAFGLGGCWAGFLTAAANNWSPLRQDLDLPQRHSCFGAMMIGYPGYQYQRIPPRNEPEIRWR